MSADMETAANSPSQEEPQTERDGMREATEAHQRSRQERIEELRLARERQVLAARAAKERRARQAAINLNRRRLGKGINIGVPGHEFTLVAGDELEIILRQAAEDNNVDFDEFLQWLCLAEWAHLFYTALGGVAALSLTSPGIGVLREAFLRELRDAMQRFAERYQREQLTYD